MAINSNYYWNYELNVQSDSRPVSNLKTLFISPSESLLLLFFFESFLSLNLRLGDKARYRHHTMALFHMLPVCSKSF